MSTTTESQPQRAMLSAEAELGMPSQPLTATPPFFQSVRSLFSRKAFLPDFGRSGVVTGAVLGAQWPCRRAGVNPLSRLTPHAVAREYRGPTFGGPGRAAHSKRVSP